jgi:PKD repeat protein
MKKLILFSLPLILVILVKTGYSQTWVEKMQDPSVNFYDVQKSFNEYYKDSEKEHRREEKREQDKFVKQLAKQTKSGVMPIKGQILLRGEKEEEELAGGWEVFKRWESYMTPRLYPSGDRSVMTNAYNEYLDNFYASTGPMRGPSGGVTPTPAVANWALIGPTTSIPSGGGGAGRVNFVRFDPTTTNTIYVGSPGGGLWKSTNAGATWATQTDQLAVIGCSDIAINPTNTLIQYLATGDGEASDTYSIGVLKTTNGGTTWLPSGLSWVVTNGRVISRLLMNPQNPNTIFAATSNGVYRTINAGGAWTQIATAVANIKDIEYKPGDTTTVYACSTTLFYKSTNAGISFVTTATGLPAAASVSRLAIAVTAAAVADVYVLASNTAYGFQGLYLSTNSGTSFVAKSTTPNILGYSNTGATAGGQGWYDLSIAVSPTNANLVIVGGVDIWKSTDGGATWTLNAEWTGSGAPYVHADIHALEFLPASATTYFAGCDGGFFKTSNTGTAWSDLSNGLQISEAYRIGLSKTNANLLNTGWQDNGTARWTGTAAWTRPLGGDGMEALIDWSNANIQYGELYYGDIRKTTTAGNYTTGIVASGGAAGTVDADGDWVTPYIEAPSNAATLFVGKSQVFKSTNSGTTWAQVGTVSGGTGNIIALANAASNINYIYAAKIDKFYACTTGAAFVDRTAGLPTASAAISYIAVDPLNALRVWVTFSGYSSANKVWYSADAGATWSNYSTGLPNLPANCIVYQASSSNDPLYVGTDVGVYYRDNTAGSWTSYSTGLPNVSVRELEIQYTALKLRAATFGRCIWQSDLYSPGAAVPVADFTANRVNICVGDCINFTDLSAGSPTSWSWTFTGAATASSTLQNPTSICYNTAGTYQVSMTATNINGSNTMTKVAYITVSGTIALPLVEGFQGVSFVPTGWYLNNPDADAYTWIWSSVTGGFGTSTKCTSIDNYSPAATTAGNIDELNTPKYSFVGVSTATMTFDVAYARYGPGTGGIMYADSLTAFVSTNCGSTWTAVYAKGGYTSLATAPDNNASAFVPTAAQWRTETVNMTPYAGQANVMVKFQARSGWGQWLYLDNINITGTGAPVASVAIALTTGTNPSCAGASVTFTATPTNGGATPTYQWQVNGVNVGGATASTFTTSTLTNGQIVTCVMTSSLGGVVGSPATSSGITMTITPLPATPTATNTGPYCVGGTISLATPTVAGATYAWTGPSAYSSALQNPTRPGATIAMAGTYSITVTAGGCTSLAGTTTVVVNPLPATPTAANTGPYCVGATIALTTPTVAGATYSWTGPLAYSSALQNPTIAGATVTMSGTYSLTVTTSGCTSLAGTTTVVVNGLPATPTATNTGPYCVGATITLATPTVAGATYSWTGPSAFSSALQNPTRPGATVAMAGTYSITVTVGGCTSLFGTTTVVVNPLPTTPTATNTGPYCAGGTISLATPTVAGATYAWTGPLTYSSATQNPTIAAATVAMAGTYSVTVTVGGCASLAGTTTVVVNAAPATPTATNTGPYCVGSTITLATPTVAGATYAWTGPSAYSSAVQNPTRPGATVAMAGTYSVTVTVGGCTSLAGTTPVVVNASPATPTATASTPVCAGSTITLTTPTLAGATYSWTGPSAFSSAVQNPTRPGATAAMAGTYSVTVTVGGCTSLAGTTAAVVVNAAPATPVASINGSTTPAAICAGGTITLTTPTVAGATYSWTGPNSYASAVRNPPALTPVTVAMGGTYSLTVTVGGCTSAAGTVSIVVNPIPATPTATNTGAYCVGATILLNTPTVAGSAYAWTGPSAYSSAVQNPTRPGATIAMSGTYSVTVTTAGCTSLPGTTVVSVSASVTPGVTVVASPAGAICAGTSVTFTATPSGGGTTPTYQWQVNGTNVGGATAATFTTSTLTNGQTVTCIMTSNSPCAAPLTGTSTGITMTVNPVVVPAVSIAAAPAGAICAGSTVTFTATPTNGGASPTYQWQVNGVNAGVGGTTFVSTTIANGDVVTCIVTSNATCASPATATSAGITMTVNATVVPSVSVVAAPSGPICSGTSVTFTASPTNGGATPTYQWQVNGVNAGAGGTTFTSTTLANGDVVTCTLTSNATCASPLTATSTGITMTVNPTPATPTITQAGSVLTSSSATGNQWYLNGTLIVGATNQNYTFTVNGMYTVVVTAGPCSSAISAPVVIINVGIDEASNPYLLSIYPNPNDGNFNVSFTTSEKGTYKIELMNALGQLIFKDEVKDFTGTYTKQLSVVDYGKGVYTISLINAKNEVVKKIVVY